MFRAAQANPFDEAVVKATDENLTSENWEYILDVCDKVTAEETGAKEAVASMIKRLAHRNANVQLYTLELANSLSQNCGTKAHKELASRSFTDALLRLANDRNTHQQVKAKILERMAEWAEMFSKDPDLGIMEQAYTRLKSQNPSLHPPSKPFKREITDVDRQKEEAELQMALALSIKDKQPQKATQSSRDDSAPAGSSQQQAPAKPISSGTTAATVSRVRALFDFQPSEAGELQFRKGDIIAVLESVYKDWWKGSLRGQMGIFPLNYVEKLQDPTQEELQQEAKMEAEVFAEIKNVEKLLTLLSTSSSDLNVKDNEEITTLYHSTLAIRPKLIELIGKYSQKKDDFTQLNEKFIKARRDYESLLEASMSQPAQHQYGRPSQAAYGFGGGSQPGVYNYPPPGVGRQGSPQPHYYPPDASHQEPQYPPQNGPAPFYMIPPGQQQKQQQQQPPPPQQQDPLQPAPLNPANRTPKPMSPGMSVPYQGELQPPASYNNPQELATSTYDSPVDSRFSNAQPQHSEESQDSYYPPQQQQQPPSQGGQYQQSPQQQPYPPQPSYQPPVAPVGSPPPQSNQALGYPSLGGDPSHQQPQQQAFQAYQPSSGGRYPSGQGVRAVGDEGDASDFYR